MEELLKFVKREIERVSSMKLYTVDENGEEIECYDGEVNGMYLAYHNVKTAIHQLIK
ncbi:MAG: hypothetical protein H9893_06255 [Candidatus Niameybacter stercoravium]|nr:hypothetical protein [Candidatus Niameybacter stercoravium]